MDKKEWTIQTPVMRYAVGNCDNYDLQLKHEHLHVTEVDERPGFIVNFNGGSLSVQRDESGKIIGFNIQVGGYVSSDFNGDGLIDGYTGPDYTGHIRIGSEFIPVRVGKPGLSLLAVTPEDGSPNYHYQLRDGQWQRIDQVTE